MAFGALGNAASAHTSPSKHPNVIVLSHVQLNVLSCNQVAASKAALKTGNHTKQIHLCIFAQKNVSKSHNGHPAVADDATMVALRYSSSREGMA